MIFPKNILASVALGAVAAIALASQHAHAQPTPVASGPAIYVSEFQVNDPEG
jgi:hypothetical protein